VKPDLKLEYARMRAELQALLEAPVKDYPRIDELVNELERVQLAIKGEHGIKGNNPNE
jgi:cell division FtsZ-interacting protein ZapD